MITIWTVSQDQDENQFGAPVASFSVPLAADSNGSLLTYTVPNLNIHSSYLATVQYCTQAGCGPNATRTLSCEKCELLSEPGSGYIRELKQQRLRRLRKHHLIKN